MYKTYDRIRKKDIITLYGTTHPTFRKWCRRAGLADFIGRRVFYIREVILIFKALGKPILARKAALNLQRIYCQVYGHPSMENPYNALAYGDLPPMGFDCLEDSQEEVSWNLVGDLSRHTQDNPIHLWGALTTLSCIAIQLEARRASRPQKARAKVLTLGKFFLREQDFAQELLMRA